MFITLIQYHERHVCVITTHTHYFFQYDFTQNYGTNLALIVVQKWIKNIQDGLGVIMQYIDMQAT